MVVLAFSLTLSAQVAPPGAATKLKRFEQNLANAMKLKGAPSLRVTMQAPAASPVCAIPLLQVGPDASFHSNMPVIAPDPNAEFAAREVLPPSPVCEEHKNK